MRYMQAMCCPCWRYLKRYQKCQVRHHSDHIEIMNITNITLEALQEVIHKTHNWKATHTECIYNFWNNDFTCKQDYFIPWLKYSPEMLEKYICVKENNVLIRLKIDQLLTYSTLP